MYQKKVCSDIMEHKPVYQHLKTYIILQGKTLELHQVTFSNLVKSVWLFMFFHGSMDLQYLQFSDMHRLANMIVVCITIMHLNDRLSQKWKKM